MLLATNTSTEDEDTYQSLLTELTDELDALPKRKKQKMIILKVNEAKYELVGRKLACMLDPFGSPWTAITVGLKVEASHEADLNMDDETILWHYQFYEGISSFSQWSEDTLSMMESDGLKEICGWSHFVCLAEQSCVFAPPIPKTEDKLMHGFNHPDIVALQEGQFNTGVMNWPTLFYKEGVYDPEDKCMGLFHSQAALWFYTHLFIGPSAAAMGTFISNALKASKNRAWGLMQMDLHELHWLIVELLDDKVDQWACQTLAWWNLQVFLKCTDNESDNDMAQICTQCAAKLAKTKQLSVYEHHAAEGLKFTSPLPKAVIPIPISASALSVSASHTSISTLTMSISATSTSSIFSSATAPPANESNLSPVPSDPEDEPAIHKAASCIPQPIPSASIITTNMAASSAPHPSAVPTGIANLKKGTTTHAKKPHHTKKANGF
ncbi:hypothetical protein J3A83DRAFT_4186234 [Scleroderma citrinum]